MSTRFAIPMVVLAGASLVALGHGGRADDSGRSTIDGNDDISELHRFIGRRGHDNLTLDEVHKERRVGPRRGPRAVRRGMPIGSEEVTASGMEE